VSPTTETTAKRTIRPSKAGPRRALVLIGVHVLVAVHVEGHYLVGQERKPGKT